MTEATSTFRKPLIESDRVEGTTVYGSAGERIGAIKRLMIEKVSGQVVYAVIASGKSLDRGVDEHTIPWGKLAYDTRLGGYQTDITESELRHAPGFPPVEHDW
jgi:sporulation protein YlmC with PRC-barrel domain